MSKRSAVVIPARFGSTRFPGKVLAELGGKPIIQWVYEKAVQSRADEVLIATDTQRVVEAVNAFGGKAVLTSPDHPSGTDRIWEAIQGIDADIIINVQGDEPFVPSAVISSLIKLLDEHTELEMATVGVPREREVLQDNPNMVKVLFDNDHFALYFSRSMIPYLREGGAETKAYHHWGIYAYRRNILEKFVSLPVGRLERCEMLEQLRAMENGIRIYVMESDVRVVGIDTPDDLEEAERQLRASNN